MKKDELDQEISRCLGCKVAPCQKACPLGVSPHDFIFHAKNGDFALATQEIAKKNPLPQTCGLVCPDLFCQKACIRARIDKAIEIPCLQAQMFHLGGYPEISLPPSNNKKVAIIGGGPSGLGALYELLQNGYSVDLYEKSSKLGGAARLIPEYRLPKSILDFEINRLINNSRVSVHLNTEITDFEKLKQDYPEGVILALGEITPRCLNIDGEHHCISYVEYLCNHQQYIGKKIAISGGGEVALDCALTAHKDGCQCVEMFVRRRREDMRIMKKDFKELDDCGITIRDLSSVTKINKEDNLLSLQTIKNQINEQGKAEPCLGTECCLDGYDFLVQALGSYYPTDKIPANFIIAGDMTGQCGTVVQALASGRKAAQQLIAGE